MIPVARLGDTHVCPIPGHGSSPIVSSSPDVEINFLGAARVGDTCGCGAVITTGFPSIIVDYRPLAYLGSPTSHGGTIITGSGDVFGGFEIGGGAATSSIIDFAKLGAIRPDGSVDDVLMEQLLADPQLEQRALLSNALVRPSGAPAGVKRTTKTPEMIAVAGAQHDSSLGNKMMFIGQAARQLSEFKRNSPENPRTLIVFSHDYTADMLKAAQESSEIYGAKFISMAHVDELIEYINSGVDRNLYPIGHFAVFSHGVPHKIAFGYETVKDWDLAFTWIQLEKIKPISFSGSAVFESYACRTGMGNRSEFPIEDVIQGMPKTNISLAQRISDHLQIKVKAFIRRSDYKNTWGSFEERQMGKVCNITGERAPDGEWCRRWNILVNERDETVRQMGFNYQSTGAINPVISGDTPLLAPGGFFEFNPK